MMRCSECQSENFEGSKFCIFCGGRCELVCSHCRTQLPQEANYCNECGRPVSSAIQASVSNSIGRDYIGALKRDESIDLPELVEAFESRLIDTALQLSEGKIMRAARLLGIKRTTLSAKLHSYRKRRRTTYSGDAAL